VPTTPEKPVLPMVNGHVIGTPAAPITLPLAACRGRLPGLLAGV
jgi:hypothetical protein